MKEATLEIIDEVNIRIHGLDIATRRKLKQQVEFMLPYARHTPAFKLGRWNGKVSYCDVGGRSYLNLLDQLLPIAQDAGYNIKVEDNRNHHKFNFTEITEDSYSHVKWPEGHRFAGEGIKLRDYQVKLINDFLKNPQGISVASTGSGKTISVAVMSHQVEQYGRSIVIVPSKDLVTQTELDYINMGLDVGVYFGDRKQPTKTHVICTWQSIDSMIRNKKDDLDILLAGVSCVIVDETHRAKSEALKKILTGPFKNVPLRWGLTGTLPEEDHDRLALLSYIGPVIGEITAKELQDQGVLSNLHIEMMQLNDAHVGFDNYASELKWLTTNKERLEYLASHIDDQSLQGNTLILVDRIETGEMLEEMIENSVFISGRVKSAARKVEYDQIQTANNKVIIASYGIASTGIDIPRIFNLYLLEPGKSFVRVIQSIGRGIRKAKDKSHVNVFDVSSTCKYSKRHLTKRKKFYRESQYPFKVKKIQY